MIGRRSGAPGHPEGPGPRDALELLGGRVLLEDVEHDAAVVLLARARAVGVDGIGLSEALAAQATGVDARGDEVVDDGCGSASATVISQSLAAFSLG
jgi:hypothetical protein